MQPWCLAQGWGKGRGWGGTQQSFIQGGSSPRSNPSPFYIPFLTNRYPFHIPSTDKWHLFHIPTCSLEFCIFLTAVNALYFKYKFIIRLRNLRDFFKAFILLRSFDRPKWQISATQRHCCNIVWNGYNIVPALQRCVALRIIYISHWNLYPFKVMLNETIRNDDF